MKIAYWDPKEGSSRRVSGGWKTSVREGNLVYLRSHKTQAEAYAAIGLTGGSMDPEYRGKVGRDTRTVAV